MASHQATCYLVVRATRSPVPAVPDQRRAPQHRARQGRPHDHNRPAKLAADEVAIKVTVEVPDAAFNPISPAALIVVPSDLLYAGPIGVEATDANPEQEPTQ